MAETRKLRISEYLLHHSGFRAARPQVDEMNILLSGISHKFIQ